MRAKCTETRRMVRSWAARYQMVSYADDKDHDSPILYLELQPKLFSGEDEPRVKLKLHGWGPRATKRHQERAQEELELDKPNLGTPVSQLAKLLSQGKLRAAS